MEKEVIINSAIKENWNEDKGKYKYLYHFTSVDSLMKILITDTFRFSNINRMNDLDEGGYVYNCIPKEERKKIFFGCFTILQDNENIRDKTNMWGLYSDFNKGVCLKINKENLDEMLWNVIYDEEYDADFMNYHISKDNIEYVNYNEICNNKRIDKKEGFNGLPFYCILEELYFKKSRCWEQENEYRYMCYSAMKELRCFYIKNFSKCIEGIYVGGRISDDDLILLNNVKEKLAKNIEIYRNINGEEEKLRDYRDLENSDLILDDIYEVNK